MSNKIVPGIYRSVIDDVMAAIKPEFEEYGVSNDILQQLQHKWETKVLASHVADFENTAPPPTVAVLPPPPHPVPPHPQHLAYPPHPMHMLPYPPPHNPYVQHQQQQQQQTQPHVKSEPIDNRYALTGPPGYTLPPLPGPQLGVRGQPQQHPGGGQSSILSFPTAPTARTYVPPAGPSLPAPTLRIPQVDGSSASDSDEESSPSPGPSRGYPSHPSHPSLPAPPVPEAPRDDEAINSDLDDSDTDGEEGDDETGGTAGGVGETDIVFCTYDKVARVKNKWKCVLKDGMIHVNGRDYLFAKCSGEFEW